MTKTNWRDKFNPGGRGSTSAEFLRPGVFEGGLPEFHDAVDCFLNGETHDIMIPVCALAALVLSDAWDGVRAGWPEIDWNPEEEGITIGESLNILPELSASKVNGMTRVEQVQHFMVWVALQDGGKSWNPIKAENTIASLVRMTVQMTGGMHKGTHRGGDISLPNVDRILLQALYWAIALHLYKEDRHG